MAHFARVDGGVVTAVVVVPDARESDGDKFLSEELGLGGKWLQTSYNTRGNVHAYGGTPLRYNYASAGYLYDEESDAFIPPVPEEDLPEGAEEWVLDKSTMTWVAE